MGGLSFFCIFASLHILIAMIFGTVALGNAAVFPFRPEWLFLSRFPGFYVPGGITYYLLREMPLNRKSVKNKIGANMVHHFRGPTKMGRKYKKIMKKILVVKK